MQVLIAEDERLERRAMKKFIHENFKEMNVVGEAVNGRMAIELARQVATRSDHYGYKNAWNQRLRRSNRYMRSNQLLNLLSYRLITPLDTPAGHAVWH